MNKAKMYRSGVGMTQDEMADALGMSRMSYRQKENGKTDWKLSEMKAFITIVNQKAGREYTLNDIFFD